MLIAQGDVIRHATACNSVNKEFEDSQLQLQNRYYCPPPACVSEYSESTPEHVCTLHCSLEIS